MLCAHELIVRFCPGHDARALGGAITQALCGHWTHEGPCRWPHRTDVAIEAHGVVTARVLFTCDPSEEAQVREHIIAAAESGWLDGPTGRSEWAVEREASVRPTRAEEASPPCNPDPSGGG